MSSANAKSVPLSAIFFLRWVTLDDKVKVIVVKHRGNHATLLSSYRVCNCLVPNFNLLILVEALNQIENLFVCFSLYFDFKVLRKFLSIETVVGFCNFDCNINFALGSLFSCSKDLVEDSC